MPKFFNLLAIFLLCFSLYSCGFQVIYNDKKAEGRSYDNEMAAIRIKKDRTHISQELKNNLYDLLNPDYIKAEPKYFLILTIKKVTSSTFITSTGASGRNKVILDITYELKNLETAQTISTGSTSVNDNYDITSNRYGTFVADEYVESNLTKIAAQNIRNSLVNDFIEVRKKCETPEKDSEDDDYIFDAKGNKIEKKSFICPLGSGKDSENKSLEQMLKDNATSSVETQVQTAPAQDLMGKSQKMLSQ